jgi:small neutral amino acid transporter SnatA (MarC family)
MPPEITFLDLFLPIFIGMGPVKVLLVYRALTKNSSTALQRKVAQKTILTVFSAEAQGLLQLGALIILVLVVAAIDLGVFLISHRLDKYLTKERILVLEKLLGIFLAAIAVQLMIDGLVDLRIITAIVH